MSIFKFFEKKKKTTEEQEVPIEELNSWLVDRINDELRGVYAQGDEIRRRIRDSILLISQTMEKMVGAESKKSALITAAQRAADIPSTEILSFEDIVELRERVARDIAHLGKAWNGYRRTAQENARGYTVRLRAQWKQMDSEASTLNALINAHSSKATALKRCQEQAKLLTTRVKEVREKVERLKALETNLESLESVRAEAEAQIERAKSTPEFEASVKLRGELSTLENRRIEVTSRVHNGFTSLARPLGKYEYAAGLGRDKKRLLDSYISETPLALSVANDSAIQEILSGLRKSVLQGRVETKNPQKTVLSIEDMMSELPKLREEYRALTGGIETLQSQLNTTADEGLKRLEAKGREATEAIERAKSESKEIREQQPQLHYEINKMVREVEREVSENFGIALVVKGTES